MILNNVLIIDDEPLMLELHARMLTGRGHSVATASGAEDAWPIIHDQRPELVLCDVMMPEIDGFALCTRLVRAGEKRMPFLFLTANDNFATLRDGLLAGGDDFLVKGMELDDLDGRVRFWLRSALSSLPDGPRRQAAALADASLHDPARAHLHPIASLGNMREDIRETALALIESHARGVDHLARGEVPLPFLGYVAGVLDALTADDLAALVRYADYFHAVIETLAPAWLPSSRATFAGLDSLVQDDLFQAARRKAAREAQQHRP